MGKYLKKFENEAAYTAAENNLATPNVALCVSENEVKYKPIGPTPPTPSLSVVAVYNDEEEVELPYYDDSTAPIIQFSRPISYDELLGLKIVTSDQEGYEAIEGYVHNAEGYNGYTEWTSNDTEVILSADEFEGMTETIQLSHGDYGVKFFRFYFE